MISAASGGTHLECARCGAHYDAARLANRCACGGTLMVRYGRFTTTLSELRNRPPGAWRYRELLPVEGRPLSLDEHETPLTQAGALSEGVGMDVFVKDDGGLPGGTFKARGAAVSLTRLTELGVKKIVMPTAGNAGGAWSLYAAAAGVDITVTMATSAPRFNQAEVVAAGGELVLVEGTIADAGRRARQLSEETGAYLAATFNEPYRLEGKKACWLEVFDRLGTAERMVLPRTIVVPVGGGLAALAATKAAAEVIECGWATGPMPRIVGVQPADCAPMVDAFERGASEVAPWPGEPTTIAAGLRVPSPSEGTLVLETVRASDGAMIAVTDAEMLRAREWMLAEEGLDFCPEGAATVVAAESLAAAGRLEGPVVVYNTGAGSKYAELL